MDKIHRDVFFEKGHLIKKMSQFFVALLCWILMLVPCVVTIDSYFAYLTRGKEGFYFWKYIEGFKELDFLTVLLLFIAGMVAVFCFTISFIQEQRRSHLTEKWPMFDVKQSNLHQRKANLLATRKFGPIAFRQNIPFCVIKSEQNFVKNELKRRIS